MFYYKAATPAIVENGMNVLKQAIEFYLHLWSIYSGNGPGLMVSQYVIMLEGLHIEKDLWSTLGDISGALSDMNK